MACTIGSGLFGVMPGVSVGAPHHWSPRPTHHPTAPTPSQLPEPSTRSARPTPTMRSGEAQGATGRDRLRRRRKGTVREAKPSLPRRGAGRRRCGFGEAASWRRRKHAASPSSTRPTPTMRSGEAQGATDDDRRRRRRKEPVREAKPSPPRRGAGRRRCGFGEAASWRRQLEDGPVVPTTDRAQALARAAVPEREREAAESGAHDVGAVVTLDTALDVDDVLPATCSP